MFMSGNDEVPNDEMSTNIQHEKDVVEEALPSEQLTTNIEKENITVATKLVKKTITKADVTEEDEEKIKELSDAEVWEVVYNNLNQILISDEFSNYSIDHEYEFGGDEWKKNRHRFDEAHEFQSCKEVLNWFFGPSRSRDSIEWESNLGSGDHGVDSYILQKDPDFNFFGLTIIQSKLHALTTSEKLPREPRVTMELMIRSVQKIVKNTSIRMLDCYGILVKFS